MLCAASPYCRSLSTVVTAAQRVVESAHPSLCCERQVRELQARQAQCDKLAKMLEKKLEESTKLKLQLQQMKLYDESKAMLDRSLAGKTKVYGAEAESTRK